jgi:cellulose synthase/poly-beta-1,6-N-acetylglucosamine synthase-like glycosyltransferase/peptidoglycan/xylan/chitin deacetylase (PgdA/CDA1 family)
LAYGKPEQWIIGIGSYGYEWQKGATKGEPLRFIDVMTLADHADVAKIESKEPLFNPSFGYRKNDQEHTVWFLDATTFYNQWMAARDHGVAGWALSRLGSEDPTVWQVVAQGEKLGTDPILRKKLEFLDGESFHSNVGEGEFLQVDATHSNGTRNITLTTDGQMMARYTDPPDYATIYHQGAGASHEVAITFDDGPDPRWTPQILDLLKARGVKAAFFLMGHNAENNPGLVQRILAEGHEIGNHTYTHPNLSLASPDQTRLELNATARLIEAITDRSTTLFRPPYNADSNPHDPREIDVIRQAQEMGYLTVGENIDPEDWERPGVETIVNRVKRLRGEGSIILLHDAGGNREQTVKALPLILDYLAKRGDEVVSLSRLVGIPPDQLMPSLEHVDSTPSRLITEIGYRLWHYGSQLFFLLVLVATGLLFVRTLLVLVLALRNRRREKPMEGPSPPGAVSIVIAAYNEEKVIGQTLKSILATEYSGKWEVVVVDDGSKDRTAEIVETIARTEPRLRLMRQANGGKSEALRHGIRSSRNEWIVFLDADTLFQPDTVAELVKPLAEERVAAVSGQARVGNARGWLTKFQALEYVCGFNLDRRAYHEWNCITVVPGAISVVRRHALEGIGGLSSDTLAEDTDMTLMLHRRGYRMAYAPRAVAWTEAPETLSALVKQRFRWAFGTLQCLWKHRDLLFNTSVPALGWLSLPSVWIFQIALVALVPFVDVGLALSFLGTVKIEMLIFVLGFLMVDLTLVVVASLIDRAPLREVWRVIPMRFLYRPLLAWVVWKSLFQAVRGVWVGWGKLERTASVRVPQ